MSLLCTNGCNFLVLFRDRFSIISLVPWVPGRITEGSSSEFTLITSVKSRLSWVPIFTSQESPMSIFLLLEKKVLRDIYGCALCSFCVSVGLGLCSALSSRYIVLHHDPFYKIAHQLNWIIYFVTSTLWSLILGVGCSVPFASQRLEAAFFVFIGFDSLKVLQLVIDPGNRVCKVAISTSSMLTVSYMWFIPGRFSGSSRSVAWLLSRLSHVKVTECSGRALFSCCMSFSVVSFFA